MVTERDWQKDLEMCKSIIRPPWKVKQDSREGRWYVYTDTGMWINVGFAPKTASFIAEAREALPYWLQRVRELEALMAQLGTQILEVRERINGVYHCVDEYTMPQTTAPDKVLLEQALKEVRQAAQILDRAYMVASEVE